MTQSRSFAAAEELVGRLIPQMWELGSTQLPNLQKCVGRDKLLGEWFVPTLLESVDGGLAAAEFDELVLVTALLRTGVVIRDHLDDEWLTPQENDCLLSAFDVIQRESETRLRGFGRSAVVSWRSATRVSREAYERFHAFDPATAVVAKNIVALVPVSLLGSMTNANPIKLTTAADFVSTYLWVLQLVDDWQDRAHDDTARVSHNLYAQGRRGLSGGSEEHEPLSRQGADRIAGMLRRYQMARSLLVRSFVTNGISHLYRAQRSEVRLTIDEFHSQCTPSHRYRRSSSVII